ncbi:hypothetical protein FA15DRAFT_718147 [Coprinopsis marcescibilis]|uniref:Uncharacterized protein n=1 Tax=Coprinopsis marcescibilis TaxID=230819 RepID=A0A5C3KLE0_COPMA|nr:hypothetical protein FA15DRAFT_718147 [Coprinopsis marcescibilis]
MSYPVIYIGLLLACAFAALSGFQQVMGPASPNISSLSLAKFIAYMLANVLWEIFDLDIHLEPFIGFMRNLVNDGVQPPQPSHIVQQWISKSLYMSSSALNLVPTLNSNNWIQWSNMMATYLQSQGLWLYVDGVIGLPDDPPSTANHRMAIGAITLKIAPSLKMHIGLSSMTVWDNLKEHFGSIMHGTVYKWVMKLLNFCASGKELLMKEFSELDKIMVQVKANKIDMPEYVTTLMERQSKPKALANRISTIKPKGQNPTYANQKATHRPFHQKQQLQPSTSSAPLPANTGNQQQQPFKKKKWGGQKVKACIAATQLAAATYSSITLDDSTMDIDTPMLPVPQNPPPPQQAIHSTLEIGKSGKALMRYARSDMPSHTYSQSATACKWVDQLVSKGTQSPYSVYQSA